MQEGLRFAIESHGCKLNFSEGSDLAGQLSDAGYARVSAEEVFDIYILNTCSVTENADKKNKAAIRKAKRLNPDSFVVVTGCYAQLKPQEIAAMQGVNLVLGAGEKYDIVTQIENNYGRVSGLSKVGKISSVKDFIHSCSQGDRTRAFLKVQDGCDYFCTFCTIPLARGLSRSPEISSLVEKVRSLSDTGVKEVVLTGVNIGDFGSGRDEKLIDLLREIENVGAGIRFRISSIEPNLLSEEIIAFVASSSLFVPHFHIPLQSGSDKILRDMKRRYDTSMYRNRIEAIQRELPDACIGADVITGFPGESEANFEETCAFIESLGLSYLHVFTYSERANTLANRKGEKVAVNERRERSRRLQTLSEKLKEDFYRKFEGSERIVLFEKNDGNSIGGYTDNYIRVEIPAGSVMENSLAKVRLNSYSSNAVMAGELQVELVEA